MELTAQQRAAATADAETVAVVAGAGTGKTRVLTARYLHLVLDRGVDVRRVLALTFTEKAAREMKERIARALRDAGRADLARDTEFAPISTIHAFLSRVLRERALDSGIDPRAVVADEVTAEFFREEALAATVDGLEPELRARLVDLGKLPEDQIVQLYEAARATPHGMEELTPVEPDLDDLRARLGTFLAACPDRHRAGGTHMKLQAVHALRGRLLDLDPSVAERFGEAVKGGVAADVRALFKEGRDLAKEYAGLAHAARAAEVGAAVVELLRRLDETYTARKRAEGLVDFADLEREGLKLLRSPAGAAVAADYDHLLVDEYQDTSRIQEAILDRLADGRAAFGVGDAKQSIYRFRYADAGVFGELQQRATSLPLAESFRSRPELVTFVNELFRAIFMGSDVQAQALEAAADWAPKEAPSVEVLALRARSAGAGRRAEARALAHRLRTIVEDRNVTLTRADRAGQPLTYRHCALLLRAMSNLSIYERALADEGVPYVVLKGRGYYAAREVVDLAHLLLLLHDPSDRFRAVAAMTSLLCGAPEHDLLALPGRGDLPRRALHAERPDAIPADRWERLTTFGRRFEAWRRAMGRVPTGDLVETVLGETRVADLLLLEFDGRRRHANLMKVLRRARATAEDPVAYARALLEFRERELRESEAPIASETDEAVKIMTVHAAKGLEFPLVAVADLAGAHPNSYGPILKPDGMFGFRLDGDDGDRITPPGFQELADWNKQQDVNERRRVLYVALTRAEEHLLLSGARTERTRGEEDDVLARLERAQPPGVRFHDADALAGAGRGRRRNAAVLAAVRRGAALPDTVERDEAGARELLARVDAVKPPPCDDTPYVAAVADLVEFARCPRRYRLKRMLGIEYDEESYGEGREVPNAEELPRRVLGTAFHEIMNDIGPGAVPDAAQVRAHLPEATDAHVATIVGWCEWLEDQEFVKGFKGKQHREMPFLTRVAGLPVRGVIDLYLPEGPLLVDYKTGAKVHPEEYAVQVAVYLAALRSLQFPVPEEAHLVYVDAQTILPVKEEPVDDLVKRFRAAHRTSFPATPGDPCFHCEFRNPCARNGVKVPRQAGLFD